MLIDTEGALEHIFKIASGYVQSPHAGDPHYISLSSFSFLKKLKWRDDPHLIVSVEVSQWSEAIEDYRCNSAQNLGAVYVQP